MIKAALFDLDGVVFDTEPQYTKFWNEEGKHYFPGEPDFAYKIKGRTLVEIFDLYFQDFKADQPKLVEHIAEFESHMSFEYVPGFPEFVSELRKMGLRIAIVTSSDLSKMQKVYQAHPEFRPLVDKVLTAEDFSKSKPDPDCYLKGAESFGLYPEDCVGFEDSFNGLKAVRAADMLTIGLATTNSEESIRRYSDFVIKDYTNWKAEIGQLFGL